MSHKNHARYNETLASFISAQLRLWYQQPIAQHHL